MKAIIQDRYGAADVLALQEAGTPEVGDDGALVRGHAPGVHLGDRHPMAGRPHPMRVLGFGLRAPRDRVRGTEVAGEVEAAGTDETRFRAGDEVFGTGTLPLAPLRPTGPPARLRLPRTRRVVPPAARVQTARSTLAPAR
jgi:NADPH:quinone reductase-like Zn-dependent oxidoreductase